MEQRLRFGRALPVRTHSGGGGRCKLLLTLMLMLVSLSATAQFTGTFTNNGDKSFSSNEDFVLPDGKKDKIKFTFDCSAPRYWSYNYSLSNDGIIQIKYGWSGHIIPPQGYFISKADLSICTNSVKLSNTTLVIGVDVQNRFNRTPSQYKTGEFVTYSFNRNGEGGNINGDNTRLNITFLCKWSCDR